jgi:hypothetical protein
MQFTRRPKKMRDRQGIDKSARYAIILISDGEERESRHKFDDVITLLDGTDIQVFQLWYSAGATTDPKTAALFSHRISLETGGTTIELGKKHTVQETANAVKGIMGELQAPYIVGYTSTNQNRSDVLRNLRVEVIDGPNKEKRIGKVREDFIVPAIN